MKTSYSMMLVLLSLFSINSYADTGRVLVVVSSARALSLQGGKVHPTGYFLSELASTVRLLRRLDLEPTYVTPGGLIPAADPISVDQKWFKTPADFAAAQALVESEVNHPQIPLESLHESDLAAFDALFVPGGHAAMQDLPQNEALGRILRYFHHERRPTALICHAPTALLAARSAGQPWIYDGYRMTVFSTSEERQEEGNGPLGGQVIEYPELMLGNAGGIVTVGAPWTSHVVRDRELITGQNPMSDDELVGAVAEALSERQLQRNDYRDVLGTPVDWSAGYTTFYLGFRKEAISPAGFARGLAAHIEQCRALFVPMGLQGYYVIASGDFEIAFQNWTSQAAADAAFAKFGGAISAGMADFMDTEAFGPY